MNKQELLNRVDFLIKQGREVLATTAVHYDKSRFVDKGLQVGFRAACLSFIKSIYTENHIYYSDFDKTVIGYHPNHAEAAVNILKSIRHEISEDWLVKISQLISANIFSDFLEMAKYLLDSKYKDPAAVMIGSVLEEHLRQLCQNHSVGITLTKGITSIPKKADVLNADLVKAGVYSLMVQKNVTAWLDLRNSAAHGKYNAYTIEHVDLMYNGVVNFIATTQ